MTDSDTELPVIRTDRVRFAETDAQGIVFYGTYFTYMDEAFNALLRAIDYRYERMHEEGWTTHVAHADLDYHAAARFEDVIESRLGTVRIGEIVSLPPSRYTGRKPARRKPARRRRTRRRRAN
jgi:acyl-CoA thioester hydrolase